MATFLGFSTVNSISQKRFRLTDFDLIKQDLLNTLNTRQGSRVMLPREGCMIWELLYEPLTAMVKQDIVQNLSDILAKDSRLTLRAINIIAAEDQNSITTELQVTFNQTNQLAVMRITFDLQAARASVV